MESGDLSASLEWEVLLRHNDHTHFDVFRATGASGSFVVDDHGDLDWSLELCATAADPQGLSAQECRALPAHTSRYSFESKPSGLVLALGGVQRTTPFTVTPVVGSNLQITAPSPQAGLTFQSWSDGGDATHGIRIGPESRTLVATFSGAGGGTTGRRGSGGSAPSGSDEQGCACEAVRPRSSGAADWLAGVAFLLFGLRRRATLVSLRSSKPS
jgi:hypothetical protein